MLKTTNNFRAIVLNETPLIDVRAPIEFQKGAFPNAFNLPIMDDFERKEVGTTYKQEGNEAAVSLGYQLVSGDNREAKVRAWVAFLKEHPNALIYCFRGGQRSRISQEWTSEALGHPVDRLEGGYKAFRNYLLNQLITPTEQSYTPIRLSGCTGSGKTPLLKSLPHHIDLEGIANHRG
ncbi:MAG: tRNA 2-selenouridine(34) synthase MnmH, partial [Vallitaleaceae bacterium]|nr:tRNA 2-selenouridine(34) synthase MnmH [Vallitaleaceae bacterium]